MIAPDTKLTDFLHPFRDLTSYSKALHVVKNMYSKKLDNIKEVTKTINDLFDLLIPVFEIKKFVVQIITYPITYGFEFVSHAHIFDRQVFKHSAHNDLHTKILTPSVESCLFCKCAPNKLVVKQIRFAKGCTLYMNNSIGTLLQIHLVFFKM